MQNRKRKTPLGRPPGPPEKVRSKRVVTLVTNAEMKKLERIARKDQRSLSAIAYNLLSNALSKLD